MAKKKGKKEEAKEHFEKGVRSRGEAVKAGARKLPAGTTHEVVEDEEGKQTLRRRRFSMVDRHSKP